MSSRLFMWTECSRSLVDQASCKTPPQSSKTLSNNIPSSMLRSLVAGSTTAMSLGLAGATISAIVFRTASIPFIFSTSIGFVVGVLGFYKDCMAKALLSIDLHPRLLQLHLDQNFPWRGFRLWRLGEFRSVVFTRSWTLQSMLLVSWLTAQPALDVSVLLAQFVVVTDSVDTCASKFSRRKRKH